MSMAPMTRNLIKGPLGLTWAASLVLVRLGCIVHGSLSPYTAHGALHIVKLQVGKGGGCVTCGKRDCDCSYR
jgi:hypothetical protein